MGRINAMLGGTGAEREGGLEFLTGSKKDPLHFFGESRNDIGMGRNEVWVTHG